MFIIISRRISCVHSLPLLARLRNPHYLAIDFMVHITLIAVQALKQEDIISQQKQFCKAHFSSYNYRINNLDLGNKIWAPELYLKRGVTTITVWSDNHRHRLNILWNSSSTPSPSKENTGEKRWKLCSDEKFDHRNVKHCSTIWCLIQKNDMITTNCEVKKLLITPI